MARSQSSADEDDASSFSDDCATRVNSELDSDFSYNTDLPGESETDTKEKTCKPAWLPPDNEHPPEYYLRQLGEFDEDEISKQDYADGTTNQLNVIKGEWHRYVRCCVLKRELIWQVLQVYQEGPQKGLPSDLTTYPSQFF
jgi:hypothetical protein